MPNSDYHRALRLIDALRKKTADAGCPLPEVETAKKTILELQEKYFHFKTEYIPVPIVPDQKEHELWRKQNNKAYKETWGDFDMAARLFDYIPEENGDKQKQWSKKNGMTTFYLTVKDDDKWSWTHTIKSMGRSITVKTGSGITTFKTHLYNMENGSG